MHAFKPTACRAQSGYRLWLQFADGLEGIVHLGNLLEIGAFRSWRDPREFHKVSICRKTACVTWAAGVRLDPEILYMDLAAREKYRPRPAPALDVAFHRFMNAVLAPSGKSRRRRK